MTQEVKEIIFQASIAIMKAAISEDPETEAQKVKTFIFTEITEDNVLAQAIWEAAKAMAKELPEILSAA